MFTQQKQGRNKQIKQGFFGQSRAAENGEIVTPAKQEGLVRRISTAKLGADQYGACKLLRRHAGPKVHYKIDVIVKSHCQCDHPENGFVTYGEAPIKIAITVIAKQARWRTSVAQFRCYRSDFELQRAITVDKHRYNTTVRAALGEKIYKSQLEKVHRSR